MLPVSTAKCFDVFICNGAVVSLGAGSLSLLPGQGRKIMLCHQENQHRVIDVANLEDCTALSFCYYHFSYLALKENIF